MLDDSSNFRSVAAQELAEECGIVITSSELKPLGIPLCPSGGGCDEFIQHYVVEKILPRSTIQEMEGRQHGLRDHGEKIQVALVPLSKFHEKTQSLSAFAAVGLYRMMKLDKK
jgi:ADP-sugar diphosphatase